MATWKISILSMIQRPSKIIGVEIMLLTNKIMEDHMNQVIKCIESLPITISVTRIRIEHFD